MNVATLRGQCLLVAFGIVAMLGSPNALAEPKGWTNKAFTSKYSLMGGAFVPQVNTTVQLDASNGDIGTEIDVEDLLGLESSKTVPFLMFNWRINSRHRIVAEYFQLLRSGEQTITGEINWGDLNFPVGAGVESSLDFRLGRLGYGYSFINDGRKELGISVGLHIASFSSRLKGTVALGEESGSVESETANLTLPLPNVGLTGGYAFTEKFSVSARALAFYLTVDDFEGYLLAGDLLAEYDLFEHFGIGAGYSLFDINYKNKVNGLNTEVEYFFHGPKAFATVRF